MGALRGKMLIIGGLVLLALYGFAAAADGNASGSAPGAKSFLWVCDRAAVHRLGAPVELAGREDFEARNARGKHVISCLGGWDTVGTPVPVLARPAQPCSECWRGLPDRTTWTRLRFRCGNVADGAYDSALRPGRASPELGPPAASSLDWEMNGRWFPWGTRPSI